MKLLSARYICTSAACWSKNTVRSGSRWQIKSELRTMGKDIYKFYYLSFDAEITYSKVIWKLEGLYFERRWLQNNTAPVLHIWSLFHLVRHINFVQRSPLFYLKTHFNKKECVRTCTSKSKKIKMFSTKTQRDGPVHI